MVSQKMLGFPSQQRSYQRNVDSCPYVKRSILAHDFGCVFVRKNTVPHSISMFPAKIKLMVKFPVLNQTYIYIYYNIGKLHRYSALPHEIVDFISLKKQLSWVNSLLFLLTTA